MGFLFSAASKYVPFGQKGLLTMTKRCFVIQGFGKKQDYEQGKLLDK